MWQRSNDLLNLQKGLYAALTLYHEAAGSFYTAVANDQPAQIQERAEAMRQTSQHVQTALDQVLGFLDQLELDDNVRVEIKRYTVYQTSLDTELGLLPSER